MTRKPKAGWATVLGVVATLALSWGAASQAAGFVFQSKNPELALSLDADNPVALVRDAQMKIATGGAASEGRDAVLSAAQASIRELPLNAAAFRLYGLVQSANSDLAAVGRQVALADRLSRRDLGAQLFLIEDAVRRNDVASALRHYDTALRIKESSRAVLFPILTEAMREPLIRQRFLTYMASPPPWMEAFLRFAIANSSQPTSIAALAQEAGGFPEGAAFATRNKEMLSVLVGAGDHREAIAFYRSIKNADAAVLQSAEFTDRTTDVAFTPISWQPFELEGIDALFLAGKDDTLELEARMESGYTGPVLRKLLALPRGQYRFSARHRSDGHQPFDTLRWQAVCTGNAAGTLALDEGADFAPEFGVGGVLRVGQDCPQQMLTLSIATRASPGDIELIVESPNLVRSD